MNTETGRSFEDLVVYQRALKFVMGIYGLVSMFPKDDLPSLVSLVKDSAVSITTNLAESAKKRTIDEKRRVFMIAMNGVEDCHMYLNLTLEHGLADTSSLTSQLLEVKQLMTEYLEQL